MSDFYDYPEDPLRGARGIINAIIFSLGFIVAFILAALWHHETEVEDESRCVDPSGHYERECP